METMSFAENLIFYLVLLCDIIFAVSGASVKRSDDRSDWNAMDTLTFDNERMFSPDYWWESTKAPEIDRKQTPIKVIEYEILNELKQLDSRQQNRIFDDLKKQKNILEASHEDHTKRKSFTLEENDSLSPLNVVELKAVQRSIKSQRGSLPVIRNRRTLNFLLFAVARAMGYVLLPKNPDAEVFPLRPAAVQSPCAGSAPQPFPCAPAPPNSPAPPPPPLPTIPSNQIDVNTIRYPYRPTQQIPLSRFAPLPPGVTVPYPPLLQWPTPPCASTPAPSPNPCAQSPAAPSPPPSPCPPKPLCPKPTPNCNPTTPPSPPPCPAESTTPLPSQLPPRCPNPSPKSLCPAVPPPTSPPTQTPPSPPPCSNSLPNNTCSSSPFPPQPPKQLPPPPPSPPASSSLPTTKQPSSRKGLKQSPLTLEYDHPVKIQIYHNVRTFLPASGTIYSGDPSYPVEVPPEDKEIYESITENLEKDEKEEVRLSRPNIFFDDDNNESTTEELNNDDEDYEKEELNEDHADGSDDEEISENAEEEEESSPEDVTHKRRYYERSLISFRPRKWKADLKDSEKAGKVKNENYRRTLSDIEKEATENHRDQKTFGEEKPFKKPTLQRVIKVRKQVMRRPHENRNEYPLAGSTVRETRRKRDLQDFDFIREYKEREKSLQDISEDGDHFREDHESPPGRTTTSIKKIEVKKFIVNKSEDDPVEYHEKTEHNHSDEPRKIIEQSEQQGEHEDTAEEEDEEEKRGHEKAHHRSDDPPPEYEERNNEEKNVEGYIHEEPVFPKSIFEDTPVTGRGVKYVTKTVTNYVGGGRAKETIKIVPIYKVIHVPAPPPPPPVVRKIVHHHHHRIPVYPKVIVTTGNVIRRRPPVRASLPRNGNILLVTIREKSG